MMKILFLLVTVCAALRGQISGGGGAGGGTSGAPQALTFVVCASAGCVQDETSNWTNPIGASGTLSKCVIVATFAPTQSTVIVDLLNNGTSVFGTNPKPTVAIGSTSTASYTVFSAAAVADTNKLIAKVTQPDAASGTPGVAHYVTLKCFL